MVTDVRFVLEGGKLKTNNYKKLSIEESYKLVAEFFAQIDKELKNENRFSNPKFIPYLYAANSVDCCISEINPSIDSIISVADIQIISKIRVLNLAESYAISSGFGTIIKGIPNSDVFLYLQNLFSRPHENESDYYLTQYISEKIKNSGFDGLSFASSKYAYKDSDGITKHGRNFVIFNYQKCTVIGSKLYRVTTISYGLQEQNNQ